MHKEKSTQQAFEDLHQAAKKAGITIADVLRVVPATDAIAKFIDDRKWLVKVLDRMPDVPWHVTLGFVVLIPQIFVLSIVWFGEWWKW